MTVIEAGVGASLPDAYALAEQPIDARSKRVVFLTQMREQLVEYAYVKLKDEDWHGVMDAAADLREIDAEMKGLDR